MADDDDARTPQSDVADVVDGPAHRTADRLAERAANAETGLRALLERCRERVAAAQVRVNDLIERYHQPTAGSTPAGGK